MHDFRFHVACFFGNVGNVGNVGRAGDRIPRFLFHVSPFRGNWMGNVELRVPWRRFMEKGKDKESWDQEG